MNGRFNKNYNNKIKENEFSKWKYIFGVSEIR